MDLRQTVHTGMRLIGPDQRDHGAVERYDDEAVYVNGHRVPFESLERTDGDSLRLSAAGAAAIIVQDVERRLESPRTSAQADELRLPLHEERLHVETRPVDLGEIRIHKTVEEAEEVRRGPLNFEEVQIERVKVNRPVEAPEDQHQDGEWLVIPIMEEVLVVKKQLVVTEEIRIRKQRVAREHEVRETVRRERATVEDTRTGANDGPLLDGR
jgi:uncharacterized protein (TIGR02271 family)